MAISRRNLLIGAGAAAPAAATPAHAAVRVEKRKHQTETMKGLADELTKLV